MWRTHFKTLLVHFLVLMGRRTSRVSRRRCFVQFYLQACADFCRYLQSVAILDKELTPEQKAKLDTLEAAVNAARTKFQKQKSTSFLAWRTDEVAQYFNQVDSIIFISSVQTLITCN